MACHVICRDTVREVVYTVACVLPVGTAVV